MNEFEWIGQIGLVQLAFGALSVVLLSLTAAISMLWQRQKLQADLVGRLIEEMTTATRDKRLDRHRRRFEKALQGAEFQQAIGPVAEPRADSKEAQKANAGAEPTTLSEGEDRLLQFIRQSEVEPLREHA